MDEESGGLHIIFICILVSILFLSYSVIPSDPTIKETVQVSSKTQKKVKPSIEKLNAVVEDTIIEQKTDEVLLSDSTSREKIQEQIASQPSVTKNTGQSLNIAVIPMNNPAYKAHKKGIVEFTHQKHVDEYKINCGQCHHDKDGKPLELASKDSVQGCIECHSETLKPKDEELDDKQKIAKYHFEAMHENCIGCHKIYNVEKGDPKGKGPAPTTCAKCHPKK